VFGLHRLLWEIRSDSLVASRYANEPDAVLAEYELDPAERDAFARGDFRTLFEKGANPYLLYFCALQLGIDRADYYAQLRASGAGVDG
jgi:hypothetical protein